MAFGNIILEYGDAGTGKSWNSQKFPEPIAHLDFEYPKAKNTFKNHNSDKIIEVIQCAKYYDKSDKDKKIHAGDLDVQRTFELIELASYDVLDRVDEFETIILDSISGLRNDIVKTKWEQDAGFKLTGKNKKGNAEVNSTTKSFVFPLINHARMKNKNVLLLAGTKPEYVTINLTDGTQDTATSGKRVMDARDWFDFKVDTTLHLTTTPTGTRYMEAVKSPWGVIPKTDITRTNVYEALHGMGYL